MHSESSPQYVGFFPRFLAFVVDSVWISLIVAPLLIAIFGPKYFSDTELQETVTSRITSMGLPAIACILFWMFRSTTPGKMVVRSTIVDAKTGEPLSKGQSLLRYLGYYVAGLPLFIGFLWVLWDPKRQGWHDKIAGSVVVQVER